MRTIAVRLLRLFDPPKQRAVDLSDQAVSTLRSLIEKIVLMPDPDSKGLLIDLYGDLTGILNSATNGQLARVRSKADLKQARFVAGKPGNLHVSLVVGAVWRKPVSR